MAVSKLLLLAAAAGGALLLLGGKRSSGTAAKIVTFVGIPVEPQAAPPPPPPPPIPQGQPSGTQDLGDDTGRAWFTLQISRNGVRRAEARIATIDAYGNGTIVADVYESIEPPSDVHWGEPIACKAARWRLTFKNGKLYNAEETHVAEPTSPVCPIGSKPIEQAFRRTMQWVQRGDAVFLKVETASGIIKYGDQWERLYKNQSGCIIGGQCDRWDNDHVESGSALIDVMWRAAA